MPVMRVVYGQEGSDVKFRRMIRISLAIAFVVWVLFLIASGGGGRYPVFYGMALIGFTVGFFLVITIVKRWREARVGEHNVVVEDRGVIVHGNYLLWEEIEELREDPEKRYQLVFRPLSNKGEPLHFVGIDEFDDFDSFVEQLREHGVKIKINRR
jgi:hypothetical protein